MRTINDTETWIFYSEIKVDCIRVSTAPVKATIDDHIQRLFDALQSSLKRSIVDDLTAAETFLQSCLEVLSQRPQTVEEISSAAEKHQEFVTTKTTVKTNKCWVLNYIVIENYDEAAVVYSVCLMLFEAGAKNGTSWPEEQIATFDGGHRRGAAKHAAVKVGQVWPAHGESTDDDEGTGGHFLFDDLFANVLDCLHLGFIHLFQPPTMYSCFLA